ncbi:DUF2461 domain-containing protein [Changchengzhania lutea]|uniref:DUF2461 domain-containing protein n=1 Tax=Changchengzhania lutea TaxID=2049305 RepID=UPI00115D69C8|nr:DUF2461 domain-containing protein [Changchengzhania lutea]
MSYFKNDFFTFFEELEKNNNKEWFHANKSRYNQFVKIPFENFTSEFIFEIQNRDATLKIEAKECILRINKDIRFSKDKSPYNLHVTAFISNGGRKDKTIPGLYIRLSREMTGIMGGCYNPNKEQLHNLRNAIFRNKVEFNNIIKNSTFTNKFGELKGEEMKRVPKEWVPKVEEVPLLIKKQFYVASELNPQRMLQDNFMDSVLEHWEALNPFNAFLLKNLN